MTKQVSPNIPFPANAWTRDQALRHTRIYPNVERLDGESPSDYKKRRTIALSNAAFLMRRTYNLMVWKVPGSKSYWYDGDQVMQQFAARTVCSG